MPGYSDNSLANEQDMNVVQSNTKFYRTCHVTFE